MRRTCLPEWIAALPCAALTLSLGCGDGPTIELLARERIDPRERAASDALGSPRDWWVRPSFGHAGDPAQVDSDGDGFTDAEENFLGSNPMGEGGACAYGSYAAEQRKRAVDIMLIIDNSSSMDAYIQAIMARVNQDFAEILAKAEVDYRVIVISRHGSIGMNTGQECDDHGICIEPPLAAGPCEPNAPPKETERFKHYSVCISGSNALEKVRRAFDGTEVSSFLNVRNILATIVGSQRGYRQWLREGAFRTFVLVTDDDSAMADSDFASWLYSRDAHYFGTPSAPNWRFHSIVNVEENPDDPYTAWPPTVALVERGCWDGTNRGVGADYQRLSMQSGGLRFPYCRNDNYDSVFRAVAASVTDSANLPCAFVPSNTDANGAPDFGRVLVRYESGRFERSLTRVAQVSSCVDDGFYVVDGEIRLCPVLCEEVSTDPAAKIRTLVACFDEATCGDRDLDTGESCDDGNRVDGDGCDAACRIELI